jgi:hypothetical protein
MAQGRELLGLVAVDDCVHDRADLAAQCVSVESAELQFYGLPDGGFGRILDRVERLSFEFAFAGPVATIETELPSESVCAGYLAD